MGTRTISDLIVATPGINGGRPRCATGGVSVLQIAVFHEQGNSPEEILGQFPHLKPAELYAALAYYHANRDEIDADLASEAAEYAARPSRPA